MKLNVPINEKSNISDLVNLGVDQFYCGYLFNNGFYPRYILSRHKGEKANFKSLNSICKIVRVIKRLKKKVNIALNEHFFPEDCIDNILFDVERLLRVGAYSFIISDINLLIKIKNKFPASNLIASTGMHITNSKLVKFFKDLGINRIILSRHLRLSEIIEIIKSNPNMEFEIFIKNIDCTNIDGFCSYVHGDIKKRAFPAFCHQIKFKEKRILQSQSLDEFACAACSLVDIKKMINDKPLILKIVGRSECYNDLIKKDVIFFNLIIELVKRTEDKKRFRILSKMFYKTVYGFSCQNNCYYDMKVLD